MKKEKIYKREIYLNKIRGFYNDDETIKVIVGIRRSGKSYLVKSIIEELQENGIDEKDIIYIQLDKKPYKSISAPEELENTIDNLIDDDNFKYLFIDEVQNVKGYEAVIDSYRGNGNMSIFITGSNSYLLSGELATKLTGRKIEIELLPLNFYEYVDMKKFLGKSIDSNIYIEFENYIRQGGFPGSLMYDEYNDKMRYVKNVIEDIFFKDIKPNEKIQNPDMFRNIQNFVINNFGNKISVKSIKDYYKGQQINIDERTIRRYIDILENAKILYSCDIFDIKSKAILDGEKKYYLADLSIYYALNTDNRINYGPVLENILHNYLLSKDYSLSVGQIGNLECDFIARKGFEDYFYLQVSKNIDDKKTYEREYAPFYQIREMYPRYLFTLDMVLQKNIEGIKNVNIVDFIYENCEL